MEQELYYTTASEADLNKLVAGEQSGAITAWPSFLRIASGETGVLLKISDRLEGVAQPLVLVARAEDHRRLCGRFAQLRSDLSPLTVWCHLMTPQRFEAFDAPSRLADFSGYEAAWTGLIIAETVLLAERPIEKLKVAACFATQSFAIARAHGLWNRVQISEMLEKFDTAQRLFRRADPAGYRLRSTFQPIWMALSAASTGDVVKGNYELNPLVDALRALERERRYDGSSEAHALVHALINVVPEVIDLLDLEQLGPEQRLRSFDKIINLLLAEEAERVSARRSALAMVAGYLATVAAGGAPSLALAAEIAHKLPEVIAWAYVVGSVGERVTWTSSFDGLGRIVARELTRPFRLDEQPNCDVALDEAQILVDNQLADPFVRLRLKQMRVVTISLMPGVNIAISLADTPADQRSSEPKNGNSRQVYSRAPNDLVAALAEAIWPYLQEKIARNQNSSVSSDNTIRTDDKKRSKQKRKSQSSLL